MSILKTTSIDSLIKYKLNKESFEIKDLDTIEDIIIDGCDIVGNPSSVDFNDLNSFHNLKSVTIANTMATSNDLKPISNIESLVLTNAHIESINSFKNLKKITITSSTIDTPIKYDGLSNLEKFEINNTPIDDFEFLKSIPSLKALKIYGKPDFTLKDIDFPLNIEYLSLDKINSLDLDKLSNYSKLKKISIDASQQKEFEKELNQLKSNGITILINDMYEI